MPRGRPARGHRRAGSRSRPRAGSSSERHASTARGRGRRAPRSAASRSNWSLPPPGRSRRPAASRCDSGAACGDCRSMSSGRSPGRTTRRRRCTDLRRQRARARLPGARRGAPSAARSACRPISTCPSAGRTARCWTGRPPDHEDAAIAEWRRGQVCAWRRHARRRRPAARCRACRRSKRSDRNRERGADGGRHSLRAHDETPCLVSINEARVGSNRYAGLTRPLNDREQPSGWPATVAGCL